MAKGRPREFDVDEALDRALWVFWRRGYEGATLADLTQAMGINRPSLYAAFGSKEELFCKVLDRYVEGPAVRVREALNEPTARAVAERLLGGVIDTVTDRRNPRGCLLVQGALACGETAESVRRELAARRLAGEDAVRQRFERARTDGDLPAEVDPAVLAGYVVTVMRGIAVQAAGGASREDLRRVAEMAMRAWPERDQEANRAGIPVRRAGGGLRAGQGPRLARGRAIEP
ncbi:MAG TPA: TetR/AcrR family transcriptional regulator [Isosphaeraceae bacterium]|nr:TetR/AcrR family transcriptional regulator [Isosphaeraceae bacterium]